MDLLEIGGVKPIDQTILANQQVDTHKERLTIIMEGSDWGVSQNKPSSRSQGGRDGKSLTIAPTFHG